MLRLEINEPAGLLAPFARLIGGQVENGVLRIPEGRGSGYLRGFLFGNSLGMMIRNCELNEDLMTVRKFDGPQSERVVMSFNNVFPDNTPGVTASRGVSQGYLPSVQMGMGKMNVELFYPGRTKFRSILIAIDTGKLKELLGVHEENAILTSITASNQALLFEELISPQIQKVATEIIESDIPEPLTDFYFRVKAEELICLLFAALLKRENTSVHTIHEKDAQKIYEIRDEILSHLDIPPSITTLAKSAGMSASKLKILFKQIFGTSIFNYYQRFRMKEAARLLREQHLSVTEVGYRMGFTNLSHFTRVFEAHNGIKPKKYSTM